MALFSDRRIVRIFEFREGDPALIVMEHVEGFELGRIGPSLEFAQRARVVAEVCDAVHHAHGLGIQHRDLKPSNIMVDAALLPRILDFGLSAGDPRKGHLKGTVRYIAPEQLDPSQPIDARTDVYALGVILYELLSGRPPYDGAADQDVIDAIRAGQPRLPIEIDPRIPEPLQAIALKAMERDPALRYQTAQDMALDLRRFIGGRPVLARPSVYASTLGSRTAAHLQHIAEWVQLRLIHPHEGERLRHAYRALDARDEDWIVESRALSYTQITLYLGAFLLVCGSLFYFVANRWYHAVQGVARPFAVLGLPFVGLNLAARHLYRRDHKAVAVAFYLAAVATLPLLLMILFDETGLLVAPRGAPNQLFPDSSVSNHQLQVTTLVACLWCGVLALSTRTMALSTVFAALAFVFGLSVAADFGLRSWIVHGRWDLLALHLSPLIVVYAALGAAAERVERAWLSRPLYRGAALLLIVLLELLAQNGRLFHYLGFSLQAWQPAGVSDPRLLDTIAAMTLNGLCFYAIAAVLRRRGTALMAGAAGLLFAVSPFAVLQPLAYLVRTNRVLVPHRLGLPGHRAGHHPPLGAPPAQELLLCRPAEHGRRAVPDRGTPAVVRSAVLGSDPRRSRSRRSRRRDSCSIVNHEPEGVDHVAGEVNGGQAVERSRGIQKQQVSSIRVGGRRHQPRCVRQARGGIPPATPSRVRRGHRLPVVRKIGDGDCRSNVPTSGSAAPTMRSTPTDSSASWSPRAAMCAGGSS